MNLYGYAGNDPINWLDPAGTIRRNRDGEVIFRGTGRGYVEHAGAPGTRFLVQIGYIRADDGRQIEAYRNLSGDPRMDCDCHGVTFADGKLWINDNQVDNILAGDGYVSVASPAVGDVAIYRNEYGDIVHSATVVSIDEDGETLVEGLGGLEVETHIDPARPGPGGAWTDPNATVGYYRRPTEESSTADGEIGGAVRCSGGGGSRLSDCLTP